MHKCDGCGYKSAHTEMGFQPFGVCAKESNLVKAAMYYSAEKCPFNLVDALDERIKRIVADSHGWISVQDGLPEDCIDHSKDIKNIKVLVAIKAKNGWTVRTQTRCKSTCGGRYGEPLKVTWYWRHFSAGEVTHWMPLPEAPKEG